MQVGITIKNTGPLSETKFTQVRVLFRVIPCQNMPHKTSRLMSFVSYALDTYLVWRLYDGAIVEVHRNVE